MILTTCKSERLDPMWATVIAAGTIEVEEKVVGGAAKVTFSATRPALHLRHLDNQPPLKWTLNRKCADGAIISETDNGLCLHIIELKSALTRKGWIGTRLQFEGMIANAIAVLAVIEAPRPSKVVCHISFLSENVRSSSTPDLVLLKLPIGGVAPIGRVDDWEKETLTLFGYSDIPLRKIARNLSSGEGIGDLEPPA